MHGVIQRRPWPWLTKGKRAGCHGQMHGSGLVIAQRFGPEQCRGLTEWCYWLNKFFMHLCF